MKRKRSHSPPPPVGSPRTSRSPRSPHSPRATRASTRSPNHEIIITPKSAPMEMETVKNGNADSLIRRSSRARRLHYTSLDTNWMTQDDVIRHHEVERQVKIASTQSSSSKPQQQKRSSSSSEEEDDPELNRINGLVVAEEESPFFQHVRFSPSAKPGSPSSRWKQRSCSGGGRAAANIARIRLQNVPSEDEQSEFNRRYSRDLRSRRRRRQEDSSTTPTRRSLRGSGSLEESSCNLDDHLSDQVQNGQRRSLRGRVPRKDHQDVEENGHDDDEEEEEIEEEEDDEVLTTRRREDDDDDDHEVLTIRRSSREHKPRREDQEVRRDDGSCTRRSSRTTKPRVVTRDDSSSSSSEGNKRQAKTASRGTGVTDRPKRSRAPVERLNYDPPARSGGGSRRRSVEEVRNMDQYSTDDEFAGGGSDTVGTRRKRYNMRQNVRRSSDRSSRRSRNKETRDTSSSSSDEFNIDEQKFIKRKSKRMNIERAKLMPLNMGKADVTKAIFRERQKVGASMADVEPMEMDMGVNFQSVGGIDDHINSLREMVMFPLLYPEIFAKYNITPPRGVLFYGPPGTGKTLLARALANECSQDGRKVAFFMRKGADCLSKWIGESERQLRLLFDQAYLMRPSIIFFDEIDGLAPVRSSRQDQIHSSIVSTLLALMDGLDNRGDIIVIGATNRIENIDPALRRPGRFDRELRFSLPTRDARKDILGLHTKSWQPPVEQPVVDLLADKTIGYCGADLKGLCAEAALNALRRRYPQVYKTNQKLALDFGQIQIREADFFKAMERMVPSTHRIQDQCQAPLTPQIRPLLEATVSGICARIEKVMPKNQDINFTYRPRLLIKGRPGQCVTTYIGPAVLHHLEKLPFHRLDIPCLFSNSARTPEEALLHVVHEARRTVPSVLYIPHFLKLWQKVMQDSLKEAFLSLLTDIQPTAPLLVLAATEGQEDDDGIVDLLFARQGEVFEVADPDMEERRSYFRPVFEAATKAPQEEDKAIVEARMEEEQIAAVPIPESRELTEREEKRLKRKEEALLRELRIFLRSIWNKINREPKFFMFRMPVDVEEVYDYLDLVQTPMDFDQILHKLDDGAYSCAQDFLDDVDLISENAITYNSDLNYETNKIICHRARALQDFAYALVKAEMDTDFEDECKEIVQRRKKTTSKLKQMHEQNVDQVDGDNPDDDNLANGSVLSDLSKAKKKAKKKVSRWARGEGSRKRHKKTEENEGEDEEGELEHEEDMEETSSPKSDVSEKKSNVGSVVVKIDHKKLKNIEEELVRKTTMDFNTEQLERMYTKMMECVVQYSSQLDRSQLTKDLQDQLQLLAHK